ncbi:MAG: hypothetical protein AABW80_01010 [Nanoarchaeota archaeon]
MAFELNDLKKKYKEYEGKYKLPNFRDLNEGFEIEKIDKESDYLLKIIRKVMMDRVINAIGFFEMLLNPVNAPRIYMPFIRNIEEIEKKEIERIYGIFADLSLEVLALEIGYDERAEAEMIKHIFDKWLLIKDDFKALLGRMKVPQKETVKREKNYFG